MLESLISKLLELIMSDLWSAVFQRKEKDVTLLKRVFDQLSEFQDLLLKLDRYLDRGSLTPDETDEFITRISMQIEKLEPTLKQLQPGLEIFAKEANEAASAAFQLDIVIVDELGNLREDLLDEMRVGRPELFSVFAESNLVDRPKTTVATAIDMVRAARKRLGDFLVANYRLADFIG